MKLSEAIRLGAMSSPQGVNGWMDRAERCALAGAADAVGIEPRGVCDYLTERLRQSVNYSAMDARFPILQTLATCPVSGRAAYTSRIIWRLNDVHRWTREQIADWVESIEAQHEQPVAEQPVTVTA